MSNKQGRDRSAVQDQAKKIADVEDGLAAAKIPDDTESGAVAVEIAESEVGNATQLRNLWIKVKELEVRWTRSREKAEWEAKALEEERASLKADRSALTDRLDELAMREAELARAELDLEGQRSAAKVGFADELRTLTAEAAQRRDDLLEEATRIAEDARSHAKRIVASAEEELVSQRTRLAEEWSKLRQDESALREREAKVEGDLTFAQTKSSMLEGQFERRLEARVADVREQLNEARQLLEMERRRMDDREQELGRLRAEMARYGEDPESSKRRNDDLVQELTKLRDELSRRPPAAEVAELREKSRQLSEEQDQAAHWRQQHDQVQRQLRYQLVSVGELEVLRDEREALQAQRETLRQALEQHRTDWEELQAKEGTKEPFPACSVYDRDAALTTPIETRPFDTLADLVDEVRNRMATDSATPFYYSESDVRLFLAGLASSRLHLLQGISGTGKTSLPREFFKALSGEGSAQIVEVQAGWRDKDDLFGFYNAFEKRFAESEFTKALYRALLPANADRPMVIVLDEMNLAHPEQYFGTMLSVLENAVDRPGYIDLLTSELPNLPERFKGARLPLPRNVWFVGTANHDETTVAFADKTYDRSHVQELPTRHVPFTAPKLGTDDPISFLELDRAFEAASRDYAGDVDKVRQFLNANLHQEFTPFGVGWGNRLERQIERFVPVVLDAGGSITEAVDHLVSTKVVRKLEDRFGVRPDDLERLADNIDSQWKLDKEEPVKTTSRIRAEADRLRGGYGV